MVETPAEIPAAVFSPIDSVAEIVIEVAKAKLRIIGAPDPTHGANHLAAVTAMIAPPAGTRIWIAAGVTDMRRGFDGLAALVQTQLEADPFSGQFFVFRGRRGDRIKLLW